MSQLNLDLRRHPLRGLDVGDVSAVRAWLLSHVEARVGINGELAEVVRLLHEGHEEVVALEDVATHGLRAAVFHHLRDRQGVRRSLREGELAMRDADGRPRRAAVVLDYSDTGWWLAWRFVEQGPEGVGLFVGEWQEESGSGAGTLPQPLRAWVEAGDRSISGSDLHAGADPDFDLRMAVMPLAAELPRDALQAALLVGRSVDPEVLRQGLTCHLVFLLSTDQVERWEVRGELPCSLDDVIRNVARLGSPRAVVLVTPGIFQMDDTTRRAVHAIAELGDHRARRVVPVYTGPDGEPELRTEHVQDLGPLAPGESWLGVEPEVELGLVPHGVVGGPGGSLVPEG